MPRRWSSPLFTLLIKHRLFETNDSCSYFVIETNCQKMIKAILIVGAGGFVGSVARYLSQLLVSKNFPSSFPWPTFAVNIVGCFIIGIVYALSAKGNLISPEIRLLLATGFCGGFTTFSSFAFDNVNLLQEGNFLYAFIYIAISVLLGILAAYAGAFLVRSY